MHTHTSKYFKFLLIFFVLAITAMPVFAQSQDDLRLGITRTFGYSSGDQIRGTFTLSVTGSTGIKSVQFLIDGNALGSVSSAPFSLTFQTTSYANGYHDITAVVATSDGRSVTLPARRFEFATSDQETSSVGRILIPILGVVVLVVVIGVGAQLLFFKNKFVSMAPGTARNYGYRGGTICPRCHRPYSIHFWAVNLLFYRVDRCDFCGKWALIHSYSMNDLRAAEQNEVTSASTSTAPAAKSEEEKLREMIDKSKFTDL